MIKFILVLSIAFTSVGCAGSFEAYGFSRSYSTCKDQCPRSTRDRDIRRSMANQRRQSERTLARRSDHKVTTRSGHTAIIDSLRNRVDQMNGYRR